MDKNIQESIERLDKCVFTEEQKSYFLGETMKSDSSTNKQATRTLTNKQQAFVEYYCANGFNASAAYRIAYPSCKAGHNKLGSRLMTNDGIKQAIAKKKAVIKAESIASRKQRQRFWTNVMANAKANWSDRLRASELLGRSEADFTDNISTDDKTKAIELTEREQAEARRLAGIRLRQPVAAEAG